MAVQEQHDLADHLLLGPAGADAQRPLGPDAGDFLEAFGCLLDGVEHGRTERLHQLLGIDRADALDHAGAEIALDALQRGRRCSLEEGGLELQPVRAVVDPDARGLDELAGADRGGGADHGHQVTLAARLDPQHAKAVLGVVVGHPLDQATECLALSGRSRAHPDKIGAEPAPGRKALPPALPCLMQAFCQMPADHAAAACGHRYQPALTAKPCTILACAAETNGRSDELPTSTPAG